MVQCPRASEAKTRSNWQLADLHPSGTAWNQVFEEAWKAAEFETRLRRQHESAARSATRPSSSQRKNRPDAVCDPSSEAESRNVIVWRTDNDLFLRPFPNYLGLLFI